MFLRVDLSAMIIVLILPNFLVKYFMNFNSSLLFLIIVYFLFGMNSFLIMMFIVREVVICKSTCPEKYIPVVMPPPNHTSLPSTAATFLATCLRAVLQPSEYSIFHGGDTPTQLSLPWRSCSCQCLNTETSARGNRGFTTETPSISYIISWYIRLVVTL